MFLMRYQMQTIPNVILFRYFRFSLPRKKRKKYKNEYFVLCNNHCFETTGNYLPKC